ncbi:hypothetical protein H9X78_16240, partial [Clostridium saudiense]|nr:hypothetical protein [Clostridium saudiense]
NYTDKELEQYILNRKLNSYKALSNEINSYKNLKFSVYDETDKKWISNEQKELSTLKANSRLFEEINILPNGNISKKIFVNGKEVKDSDYYRDEYYYNYGYYDETVVSTISEEYGINDYVTNNNHNLSIYLWMPQQIQKGDSIYTT